MKKYCLYLEPTVFIFKDSNYILLYDSESKKRILLERNKNVDSLIDGFLDINNMYCIEIEEDISQNEKILIEKMRNNYLGDILPINNIKPICIPPVKKIHTERRDADQVYVRGTSVMTLLNEMTFHLNGYCNQKCEHCTEYNKQFNCCYKNVGELNLKEVISRIENFLATANTIKINFTGGNVFYYKDIDGLLNYILDNKIKSNFCFNYLNWDMKFANIIENYFLNFNVYVFCSVEKKKFDDFFKSIISTIERVHFVFVIKSEKEYVMVDKLIKDYHINWYTITPFYDGCNLIFFQNYVYTDSEDLELATPTKQEIYKKQSINLHDFGKLIISSCGKFYSNINYQPLGDIKKTTAEIIEKEWELGSIWKRVRNQEPCTDCVYQYLCPSPSNYEIVIGKNNLCHIKKEF